MQYAILLSLSQALLISHVDVGRNWRENKWTIKWPCQITNMLVMAAMNESTLLFCPHAGGCDSAPVGLVNADKDGHEDTIDEQIRLFEGKYGLELTRSRSLNLGCRCWVRDVLVCCVAALLAEIIAAYSLSSRRPWRWSFVCSRALLHCLRLSRVYLLNELTLFVDGLWHKAFHA